MNLPTKSTHQYSHKITRTLILPILLGSIGLASADGYIQPLDPIEYNSKLTKEMYVDNDNYTRNLSDLYDIKPHEYEGYDEIKHSKVLKITIDDKPFHGSIVTFKFNPSNNEVYEVTMPDVISNFTALGMKISPTANDKSCTDGIILSAHNAQCSIRIIPTNEGIVNSRSTIADLNNKYATVSFIFNYIQGKKRFRNQNIIRPGIKILTTRVLVQNTSELYVACAFRNNENQYHVAMWNGTQWQQVGTTGFNSWIETMALSDNNLYAAGDFTNNNDQRYVARWDGTRWQQVGTTGFNHGIRTIAILDNNNIHAAGEFTNNKNQQYVAHWNGTQWQQVGAIRFNDVIKTMIISGNSIYAAGWFTNNNNRNLVAHWNGERWRHVGSSFNEWINTIAISDGKIYAGGGFTNNEDQHYVARWDGTRWQQIGTAFNEAINTIVVSGNNIYVSSSESLEDSQSHVFCWNGTQWQQIGTAFNEAINTMVVSGNNIYVAGNFTNDEDQYYVARWDGTRWQQIGEGFSSSIYTLLLAPSVKLQLAPSI